MNDLQIEAFLAVLQYSSFSKAAQAIYVPQPTISHRISQLEESLGVTLLQRSTKGMTLTPAGENFLPYAKQIYASMKTAKEDMHNMKNGLIGTLTIGACPVATQLFMTDFLKQFIPTHPSVSLRFFNRNSEELLHMLEKHLIDIALTQYHLSDTNIICEPYFNSPILFVASPIHPFARKTVISLKDACEEKMLLFPKDRMFNTLITSSLAKHHLSINNLIEMENISLIKSLVAENLGVTFMPETYIKEELAAGKLQIIPLEEELDCHLSTYICYKQNCSNSLQRLFLKDLRTYMQQL